VHFRDVCECCVRRSRFIMSRQAAVRTKKDRPDERGPVIEVSSRIHRSFVRLKAGLNGRCRAGSTIFARRCLDLRDSSPLLHSFAFCGHHLRA